MTGTVWPLPAWVPWLTYLALVAYLAAPIWRRPNRNRKDQQ